MNKRLEADHISCSLDDTTTLRFTLLFLWTMFISTNAWCLGESLGIDVDAISKSLTKSQASLKNAHFSTRIVLNQLKRNPDLEKSSFPKSVIFSVSNATESLETFRSFVCSIHITKAEETVYKTKTMYAATGLGSEIGLSWPKIASNINDFETQIGAPQTYRKRWQSLFQSSFNNVSLARVSALTPAKARPALREIIFLAHEYREWACASNFTNSLTLSSPNATPPVATDSNMNGDNTFNLNPSTQVEQEPQRTLSYVANATVSTEVSGKIPIKLLLESYKNSYKPPLEVGSGAFLNAHEVVYKLFGPQAAHVVLNMGYKLKAKGVDIDKESIRMGQIMADTLKLVRTQQYTSPKRIILRSDPAIQQDMELLLNIMNGGR